MAFHPMEADVVGLFRFQKTFPQVGVLYWLLLGVFPSAFEPSFNPVLVEGVYHVLRIGVHFNGARAFECFQPGDNSQKLHAVVGGAGVPLR